MATTPQKIEYFWTICLVLCCYTSSLNAKTFRLLPGSFTWTNAQNECVTNGGRLAELYTQAEFDEAQAVLNATYNRGFVGGRYTINPPSACDGTQAGTGEKFDCACFECALGTTSYCSECARLLGGFKWESTGTSLNATEWYTEDDISDFLDDWATGNPTIFFGVDASDTQECLELLDVGINDQRCSETRNALCEFEEVPTEAPTDAPTTTPTAVSTMAPTDAPTMAPTDAPTMAPTDAPTSAPVDVTEAPTVAPTDAPTDAPTVGPTSAPVSVENLESVNVQLGFEEPPTPTQVDSIRVKFADIFGVRPAFIIAGPAPGGRKRQTSTSVDLTVFQDPETESSVVTQIRTQGTLQNLAAAAGDVTGTAVRVSFQVPTTEAKAAPTGLARDSIVGIICGIIVIVLVVFIGVVLFYVMKHEKNPNPDNKRREKQLRGSVVSPRSSRAILNNDNSNSN